MVELYPYQKTNSAHLTEALTQYRAAVDASDPGTGKTLVACQVVRNLDRKPLVVCPKAVVPSWTRWLREFEVEPLDILTYEALRTGNRPWVKRKMRCRNDRKVEFYWKVPKSAMLVVDEAHMVAGVDSLQSIMVGYAKAYSIPTHFMSATLAESPVKMRCLGFHLGLHRWLDFVQWALRNGCFLDLHKKLRFVQGPLATDILLNLHHQVFPKFGCRVRIADLGDVFPDNIVMAEAVTVTAPDLLDTTYHDLEARRLDAEEFGNVLAAQLFARQQAETMKVPALVEMAKDVMEENGCPVIFVNFRDTMERLHQVFHNLKHGRIHGDDTDREDTVQRFQSGELKLLLVMVQAGGVGLSLHDMTGERPRVALISPPWSAVALRQTLGRIHRAGGKSPCVQRLLYAAGTIEERVCETVRRKLNNLSLLNDGDLDPLSAGLNTKKETADENTATD